MYLIDMNSDLGESFGTYVLGDDEAVLKAVSSANVACGFHAGDPQVMEATVKRCARHGVSVGAHPAHPDLQGFGRRTLDCTPQEATPTACTRSGRCGPSATPQGCGWST